MPAPLRHVVEVALSVGRRWIKVDVAKAATMAHLLMRSVKVIIDDLKICITEDDGRMQLLAAHRAHAIAKTLPESNAVPSDSLTVVCSLGLISLAGMNFVPMGLEFLRCRSGLLAQVALHFEL